MTRLSSDSTVFSHLCPCCSGNSFSSCCERVFKDHTKAANPLMLMRSRYTAFVLGNTSHLLATWDDICKPPSLPIDEYCKWLKLEILEAPAVSDNDDSGYVYFKACFIENNTLVTLLEKSRFIRKNEKWYYQDGETEIEKSCIPLKSQCPCGSGRKFKRCCIQHVN